MFEALDPKILPNKNDPQDPRLEKLLGTKAKFQAVLQGYPDDEGILLNGGRPGSAQGPDAIRRAFYKMTPWLPLPEMQLSLSDLGNLQIKKLSLKERHRTAQKSVHQQMSDRKFLVSLGGGHDYGFADAAGFLDYHLKKSQTKPVVINFDAHLDVRPAGGDHHSGTPFRRLLETYKNRFHFLEVGLQPQCNSPEHWNWLLEQKGKIIPIELIEKQGLRGPLKKTLSKIPRKTPLWLSIDIDGFHQAEAPGCSQSWVRGFSLKDFLPALADLVQNFDLAGIGLYEVSPPLDIDSRTSKLAALIIYETLRLQAGKTSRRASRGKKR